MRIKKDFSEHIKRKDIRSIREFDDALITYSERNENKVNSIIYPASFMAPVVISFLNGEPKHETIAQLYDPKNEDCDFTAPARIYYRTMVAGKAFNSKCKLNILYIYVDGSTGAVNFADQSERIKKVAVALRKGIASGKSGESAVKIQPDGSFLCPFDTISENVKLVEDAISNSGFKESIFIRLDVDADSFYSPDQKKYDFENAKKASEPEEMEDAI